MDRESEYYKDVGESLQADLEWQSFVNVTKYFVFLRDEVHEPHDFGQSDDSVYLP